MGETGGTTTNGAERRVLITGANGFVGRHLIAHLLDKDLHGDTGETQDAPLTIYAGVTPDHVAAVSGEEEAAFGAAGWRGGSANGRVWVVACDLSDTDGIQALLAQVRPQQVYHLAARASGADTDREAVFAVNVQGTRTLLDAAAALTPFPRVLLVSTGYVYGSTAPERPAREDDPLGPLWRYGAYTDSKIEMESVARGYRALTVTARAFSHTGPGQMPAFAVPAFARQIARMEAELDAPTLRVGNLEARRDLLDVRDVVRAYALLMAQATPGEAYNVANGQPVVIRDVLEGLRGQARVATHIEVDPARLRPADIACSSGNPARLRVQTGWQPRYRLEETLRDTLEWWRGQIRQQGAAA